MERDLAVFGYIFAMENFNSHAHVERDGGEIQLRDQDGNFNSHAHVERDEELDKIISNTKISTHTLTWSVTFEFKLIILLSKISTHTLTWSVTLDYPAWIKVRAFQLTRSRGA